MREAQQGTRRQRCGEGQEGHMKGTESELRAGLAKGEVGRDVMETEGD